MRGSRNLFQTKVQEFGKCTYKIRNTEFGSDGVLTHKDSPLLAPVVYVQDGIFHYDFKNILILDDLDLDMFITNMTEIKDCLNKIR